MDGSAHNKNVALTIIILMQTITQISQWPIIPRTWTQINNKHNKKVNWKYGKN